MGVLTTHTSAARKNSLIIDPEMTCPAIGVEAGIHHHQQHRSTFSSGTAGGSMQLVTRARLASFFVFCCCQWVFVRTVAPYFAPGLRQADSSTSGGRGIRPGAVGANSSVTSKHIGGDREASEVSPEVHASRRPPRILTVLTTYSKRSKFIKPYKEAVSGRSDGYRPTVFVASNEEDKDPDEVVDFKTGSWRQHRLLAAIAEASSRYAGTFEWLAIGDDDTAFLYNRAAAFLSHIDHSQPVAIGVVDGLNLNAAPCPRRRCFSSEQKRNASSFMAASGCCDDFTNPCEVPAFPESAHPPGHSRNYSFPDYGGGGLFWPFGGAGFFVSKGFVDVIGGEDGFRKCFKVFGHMNTDVQVAACFKLHGYSVGLYTEGFSTMETSDPAQIQDTLASDCQILGVHLGIRHLEDGSTYTPQAFGAAVAAVREADILSARGGAGLETSCPESLAKVLKHKIRP